MKEELFNELKDSIKEGGEMTLKDEFYKMYHNPINDDEDWEDIWQWIEEKIEYTKDDVINWFGDELDRLVRTQQIDMIHTDITKIISDAKNELKEKK